MSCVPVLERCLNLAYQRNAPPLQLLAEVADSGDDLPSHSAAYQLVRQLAGEPLTTWWTDTGSGVPGAVALLFEEALFEAKLLGL